MCEYSLEQSSNLPETEPKITLQVTWHLQPDGGIQNLTEHLKWSKKERLRKTNHNI